MVGNYGRDLKRKYYGDALRRVPSQPCEKAKFAQVMVDRGNNAGLALPQSGVEIRSPL